MDGMMSLNAFSPADLQPGDRFIGTISALFGLRPRRLVFLAWGPHGRTVTVFDPQQHATIVADSATVQFVQWDWGVK